MSKSTKKNTTVDRMFVAISKATHETLTGFISTRAIHLGKFVDLAVQEKMEREIKKEKIKV